jgi:hypothetical protein
LHELFPAETALSSRLRLTLAHTLALFFAVNFAGTEMVIWCHIHGYLLFVLLILGGLLRLLDECCGRTSSPVRVSRLAGAFVLTLLADYRPLRLQIDQVQHLVDRHGHEPGFAISFDPSVLDSVDHFHGLALLEILFYRFIDHERPTHIICAGTNRWKVVKMREMGTHCPFNAAPARLPTFIQTATDYMLFLQQGRYYGLYHWEGRFRMDRRGYSYLLEGDSPEKALQQIPAALLRIEADCQAGRFSPRKRPSLR